ncbi:MAG: family 78 glycoside hydrolase catalytic domain [Mediterranea sp.]|jgi:alpha-L-rhamnosidase|nr:family 78 glycoside hydrolase catalytic domain [Mediterranea sp.]
MKKLLFILLLLLPASMRAQEEETLQSLARQFASPADKYKAHAWWHWMGANFSKEGIGKDLRAMKEAGIGGVVVFNAPAWLDTAKNPWPWQTYRSDAYWDALEVALQTSKDLGMEVGIHNSPGWSTTGGPWIKPGQGMQAVAFSITKLKGGRTVRAVLPNPKEGEATAVYFKDVAVMAIRDRKPVTAADIVDVSAFFEKGILTWEAPTGDWTIYRFGYAPTMQHTHPTPEDVADSSLEVDKMNPEATKEHWTNVLGPLRKRFGKYIGTTFNSIWIDSYEARDQNWSPNFREDFIRLKGYDPVRQIILACQRGDNLLNPEMNGIHTPRPAFAEETNRFLQDYAEVINRLFLNCWAMGKELVNEAGFSLCFEPYGSIWDAPFDLTEGIGIADIPVTEFWVHSHEVSGGTDFATAAARSGKRIVGAEAFTGMEATCTFTETPAMLKRPADMGYAAGCNRYYLHSWAHNPLDDTFRPGWSFAHYGTHFGRNQTWFEPGKAFFTYLARCQMLLQQGAMISTDGFILQRSLPEAEIFFVRNPYDAAEKEYAFPVTGRVPELWDAYTGTIRSTTHWRQDGNKMYVALRLEKDESVFVVFTAQKGAYPVQPEAEALKETATPLHGNWKVTFHPKTGEASFTQTLTGLVDLSKQKDKRLSYFSGTAVYETTFTVSARDLQDGKRLTIDLGELYDLAELEINGKKAGVLWMPPYKADISAFVRDGENILQVHITNTWVNRLIGDEQYPADFDWTDKNQGLRAMTGLPDWLVKGQPRPVKERKAFVPWYYFGKDSPLLPAGLLGPVTIARQDVPVYDLQCEYLTNPLGIDDPYHSDRAEDFNGFSPRVSWKIDSRSETGKQQAYRVVVTNTQKDTVWDSGIRQDNRLFCFIPGSAMTSGTAYDWKVGVYDRDLSSCTWSGQAHFSTGLLDKDWQGKWIKHPSAPAESHIRFRKEFILPEGSAPGKPVFAYVASIGYHELYVNGTKVDDRVLAPAASRLDKRVLYVTYDIRPLLKDGRNLITVDYAPGWSMNNFFAPRTGQGLLVQVYGDGKHFSLASDATWTCTEGHGRNIGRFDFMDMGGELVDDTKQKDANWVRAAETTPYTSSRPILTAQMTDPSRIIDTIPAKAVSVITDPSRTALQKTIYRVDMGKEFTGFLQAEFDGLQRGDTVEIMISMRDDDPERVEATYGIGNKVVEEQKQRQLYIARGQKGETFRNRFNFFAGRYIHFRGLRKAPELKHIKGLAVSSAAETGASFACSDTLYNRIFALDTYTYQMCHTEGVTVDCPNRERLGYGPEGAYQTAWGLGLPYFRSAAHYVKNVRDWADVQFEDGFINNVAPQISDMYGCALNGTAILNIAWEHYRLYGDKRILELAYPVGRKWLGFLSAYVKDDMLTRYADHGYFLGEWVSPGPVFEYAETEEALFFNNCAYAMTLDFMCKIGDTLADHGDTLADRQETATDKEKLSALRNALHRTYYYPGTGCYLNGDQVRTSFALYAGLVPDSLTESVEQHLKEKLKSQGYIDIGSFGRYPFYQTVLGRAGYLDPIGKLLSKTTYPGYGYFVAQGCTTFPEMWEINQPNSTVIHTSYTGISAILIKGFAGIREETCGSDTILIAPEPIAGLTGCSATVETPYGTVRSAWQRSDDGVNYRFTIPFGMVARLRLKNREDEYIQAGDVARSVTQQKVSRDRLDTPPADDDLFQQNMTKK